MEDVGEDRSQPQIRRLYLYPANTRILSYSIDENDLGFQNDYYLCNAAELNSNYSSDGQLDYFLRRSEYGSIYVCHRV